MPTLVNPVRLQAVVENGATPRTQRPMVQPWALVAGETDRVDVAVVDVAGAQVDLTGHAVELAINTTSGVAKLRRQATITDSPHGLASFPLAIGDTKGWAAGPYVADVWVLWADGSATQVVPASTVTVRPVAFAPGDLITALPEQLPLGQGAPGPAGIAGLENAGVSLPTGSALNADGAELVFSYNSGVGRVDATLGGTLGSKTFAGDLIVSGAPNTASFTVAALSGAVSSGAVTIGPPADSSGAPMRTLNVTAPGHTSMSAVEYPDAVFDLSLPKQFATGASIALQRAARILPPTYTATAATQVLQEAATLAIGGAPTAGLNVSIPAAWSLKVEAGQSQLPAASAAAPALTLATAGKDTGLYAAGVSQLGVSAGGSGVGVWSSTGLTVTGTATATNVTATSTVTGVSLVGQVTNATNNGITTTGTLTHLTSGSPASGIGVRLDLRSQSAAGQVDVAHLSGVISTVTGGSEKGFAGLSALDGTGTVTRRLEVWGSVGIYVGAVSSTEPGATIHAKSISSPGASTPVLIVDKDQAAGASNFLGRWRRQGVDQLTLQLDSSDNAILQPRVGVQLWSPNNTGNNAGYIKLDDIVGATLGYSATTFLQLNGSSATMNFGSGVGQLVINSTGVIIGNGSGVKIGFFDKSPVVRDATTFTLNSGSVAHDLPSGATLPQVEQVLRQLLKTLGNTSGHGLVKADL